MDLPEGDCQGILVNRFDKTISQFIGYIIANADDLVGEFGMWKRDGRFLWEKRPFLHVVFLLDLRFDRMEG